MSTCRYCENTKIPIIEKSFAAQDEKTLSYVWILENNLELVAQTSNDNEYLLLSTKINYCPICGRKLSEEEIE